MKNTLLSLAVLLALTVPARGEVIQGQLTGPFGNTIDTRTEGTFLLHRSNAGTVTITATDSDANTALSIQAGGTSAITIGDADSAVTLAGSGGLTLANGESLNTDTDAVFDFTRDTAGSVTLTCSDDDATCAAIYDAGGAAAITVGSADVTSITLFPDNDLTLRNGATGSVTLDFRDYADSADDDMAHVIQTVNCTDATTGAEDCDWTLGVVEAGAAAETRIAVDADGGVTIGSANNGSNVSLSTDLQARNSATGNVDISFRDYADTTDDDMAHTLLTTNCTDTGTGTEDCDFEIRIVEAGVAAEARLVFDADGDITLGSANNAKNISLSTGAELRNSATGNVDLDFRDYADSADDDQAHVILRGNLTDATTGAEDADFEILAAEAGAAPVQRFLIDGDGGTTIGATTNDSFTVTTDGTGTGEVVLPLQSIAAGEIVNDTVDGTELADTLTLDAALVVTGAFAHNYGNSLATAITIATDGTGDAELVLPLLSVSNGELTADTVDGSALADTLTLDAALIVTGAFSHNYGNSTATTITLATDGTGDAELVLPGESVGASEILDGSVGAAEIANPTSTINLPIASWVPCAGTVAGVWDASAADTEPDLAAAGAIAIEYDATGGSIDADTICNAFTVPDDYVSGGSLQFRLTQASATVTVIEDWACQVSVDGGTLGGATTTALVNQTAAQTISMTPAGTWAAGASIGVVCNQSDAAADDTVRLLAGHAEYTASQ